MSIVVTNWGLALIWTALHLPLRAALRVFILTLILAVGLSMGQRLLFPKAGLFFLRSSVRSEVQWTQPMMARQGEDRWTPLDNVRTILLSSAVAPRSYLYKLASNDERKDLAAISNQTLQGRSYSAVGWIAVAAWIALLLIPLVEAFQAHRMAASLAALTGFMASQILLFMVYGEITFLFVGDYFPALIVIAAHGALGRLRRVHLFAATLFIICAGISNTSSFVEAARLAVRIT